MVFVSNNIVNCFVVYSEHLLQRLEMAVVTKSGGKKGKGGGMFTI